MPAYMGNVGHLMQHWTLCELLRIAGKHRTGLNFIDAHAMAPWATQRMVPVDRRFDHVQGRLVNQPESTYERAWHTIKQENQERGEGYPNSAAFVEKVWKGDFSLLLCETDGPTIAAIEAWLPGVQSLDRCKRARRFHGDWRKRFAAGLASPSTDGLSDEALTLVSLDPDMYYPTPPKEASKRNLYPCDLERIVGALDGANSEVIIQLSTYSRGNRNQAPQSEVIKSVNAILMRERFELVAVVKPHLSMMSLVYGRKVPWRAELADLPDRFTKWLP